MAEPSFLTVTEQVVHRPSGGDPAVVSSGWVRRLSTDEQPFRRNLTLDERWVTLERGWLDRCGMLVIRNDGVGRRTVNPTSEQRAEDAGRVVEIAFSRDAPEPTPDIVVLPGETVRFQPADPRRVRLRCRQGTAKITVDLMPE